jgi:uncharacterized membrane protein YqaE (UPF0057 family)
MKQKNKKVIEHFGSASEFSQESDSIIGRGMAKTSFTKTGFCAGVGQSLGGKNRIRGRRPGDVTLVPNQDQMSSEFSKFNPIWLVFPILNLAVDILIMIYEVFFFVFKIVFLKVYELMVPKSFNFGLKSGKKYCFNLLTFRMLITFLCPPMGVFMAYGVRGFVQIAICAVLSLLFYVPGLVYGLIVILRSDVAEHIEQTELQVCGDNGDTSLFTSGEDNSEGKCSRGISDTCSIKGKPMPGDPKKLDCCEQPVYDKEYGWTFRGSEAKSATGGVMQQFSDGERKCKMDFHTKMAPMQGICVYKKTGRPG